MRILISDENERSAQILRIGLMESGYAVDHASRADDSMILVAHEPYDAIIIERVMSGATDGLGMILALRARGNTIPIVIVSALSEVEDRILCLKSGADDYLVKPFVFGELLARLEAILRRSQKGHADNTISVGDLTMDLFSRKVTLAGKNISLLPREFKLLEYLMRHVNQVVTRTMLLENVWDYHFDPQTNVVDVHISKLRQKIEGGAVKPMLRTIRNAGYILTADS